MLPPSVELNDNSPRSPNNNSGLMPRSRGSLCVPHSTPVVLAIDTKRRSWCGVTSPAQAPTTRRYGEVGQVNKHRLVKQIKMLRFSEGDEIMNRIQSNKSVIGAAVINSEGIPVKSTLDNTTTEQYATLIRELSDHARSVVRDLDPRNDLTFLRMQTKKHEVLIAPDSEFSIIVVQKPCGSLK